MQTRLVASAFLLSAVVACARAQQSPAPIERTQTGARNQSLQQEPAPGVFVRTERRGAVQTVATAAGTVELRLTGGRADVILDHPEPETEILVDMPGGQVSLLKDGFYTFNADTDTTRVLRGEAIAYPGPGDNHGTKIKEAQQLTLTSGNFHVTDADRFQLAADLLPGFGPERGEGYAQGSYGDGPVLGGYGPYGDGFYGGPAFAGGFGYPYGFGYGGFYPYGFSYPFGFGVGLGYYGGFGGYRGGFGGFRGGFRR